MPGVVFLTRLRNVQKGVYALLSPRIFVPVAAVLYLALSIVALEHTLQDPKGRADLPSGDAGHYMQIGAMFAGGDWSMSYVKARPHRQPLYPAALSPIYRFKGGDFFWLAMVNILFATFGFVVAYVAVLYLHHSRVVAALASLLYLTNGFLFAQTTHHFMTEPLHILLMIGGIFAILAYLEENKPWQLFVAVATVGLDYLTRPNGLFIMAALMATLVLRDAIGQWRSRRWPTLQFIAQKSLIYGVCVAIFMLITIPSWVPRLEYFGSPFYHGYLANYLWVDTYKEGHVGQQLVAYHWQDYVRSHTVWDAIRRELWGIWNVCFYIPYGTEGGHPRLFLLAIGGFLVAMMRGPAAYRLLFFFGVVQLLPLIWTNLSNPNVRVPYASTMPIEYFFAALFLACAVDVFQRFIRQREYAPRQAKSTAS